MKLLNLLFIFSLAGLFACQQSDMQRYTVLLRKERESSKVVNDIYFGISLGMPSKDFYTYCWEMNKKGMFKDGPGNTCVMYQLDKKELKYPGFMTFYPEFKDGTIYSLWTKFEYSGWMPWNKQLSSDSLLPDVIRLYEKWYPTGNRFMKIENLEKGDAWVKVDGNRRILIRKYDDMDVKVDYVDTRREKAQKALKK
jgi:hypothetical protein